MELSHQRDLVSFGVLFTMRKLCLDTGLPRNPSARHEIDIPFKKFRDLYAFNTMLKSEKIFQEFVSTSECIQC
jgi:hypothetical protein